MNGPEAQRIKQKYKLKSASKVKIRQGINPFNEGNKEFSLETIDCVKVQEFISYCGVEDVAFFVRFYAKYPDPAQVLNVDDVDKDVDGHGGCIEECIVKVFPDLAPPRGHPIFTNPVDQSFRHIFQKDGHWHLVMREYFPATGELGKWKTAREYANAFPRVCGLEDELRDNVVYGANSSRDCDDSGLRKPALYRRSRRLAGLQLNPDVEFDAEVVFGEDEEPVLEGGEPDRGPVRVGRTNQTIADRLLIRRQREERAKSLRSFRKK